MKRKKLSTIIFTALLGMVLCKCTNPVQSVQPNSGFNISFKPTPPKDLADSNASSKQLIEFAWEEFFALNWKSSYSKDGLRDHPDTLWNYSDTSSAYPNLAVWETYAHRSELRPYSDTMLPFDSAPHYSYGDKLYPADRNANFRLFDVLDENNEIGSCDIYAHVNKYDKQHRVLYQAKVNRYEYDYVLKHYPNKSKLITARAYTAKMIDSINAYYPGVKNSCDCPPDYQGITLPCGSNGGDVGAMEVKTAWRELTPLDDSTKFFTRKVVYFRKEGNKIVYANKTYALIGLHIIHKTKNYNDFVFATWEHVDVQKDSMGYILLDTSGKETGKFYKGYPRLHPIPAIVDSSTQFVHDRLRKMNPKSIWLNYRLVGVQGKPTGDSSTFNYFLANYVVESDSTLADFKGSGIGTPDDGKPNILYDGQFFTMGGCQGCHGVAQKNLGGDFSFLLDTVGKPIKQPDLYGDHSRKLMALIEATKKSK